MQKKETDPLISSAGKIRLWYACSFLLLILALFLTNFVTKKYQNQVNDVSRTDGIINNLELTISYLKDAETGIRGFLIMNDSAYLEPYLFSRKKVDSVYQLLDRDVKDSAQRQQLFTLARLTNNRYRIFSSAYDTLQKYNNDITVFRKKGKGSGKLYMDSLRFLVNEMQQHETGLMDERQQQLSNTYTVIYIINISAIIIGVALTFFTIITFNKENKARSEADQKAGDYRKRLEARVMELRSINIELSELRSNEKFASTGRIARTIAHEVRNPLTNINLATEQLQEDITEIDGSDMMVAMIRRNSQRIQQLIADLLQSTRFSELNFEQISLHTLLDQTIQQAQDRFDLNSIKVVKEYHAISDIIKVDSDKIKMAFLNIMLNAVEAMEPGKGVLTISTSTKDNYAVIKIADNGMGMNQETLQRLFEPYFTQKEKGNGLGLTNTQNIILNHKGIISAESELGVGSTFIIMLPG